jgi:hypothetical protein
LKDLNKLLIIVVAAMVAVALVVTLRPKSPSLPTNEIATPEKIASRKGKGPRAPLAPLSPEKGGGVSSPTPGQRRGATEILKDMPGSVDELRDAIFGADPEEREQALNNLARLLSEGKGKKLLLEMIESQDPELEEEVTALMPNLAEEERLPLLDKALDSPSAEFRLDSLMSTRDIVGQDVNDLLLKAMKDTDEEVLEEVADLLVYFDDHAIFDAAFAALSHDNEEIWENALGYFEDSHTLKSVEYLIQILRGEFRDQIVSGAGDALRFITDEEIENNDYEAWSAWFDLYGEEWARENDAFGEDLL